LVAITQLPTQPTPPSAAPRGATPDAHQGEQRAARDPADGGLLACLSTLALHERAREEINRAGRHGTALSCVALDIEDLAEIARAHGADLAERTLAYAGLALRHELRGFDRVGFPGELGELAILLPGADGMRAELVARRILARLRALKLEVRGERRALRLAIGLAVWRKGMSAERLLTEARAAAGRERLGFQDALRL
jgi:diguanylate cyclase (GGDEF)-like protein